MTEERVILETLSPPELDALQKIDASAAEHAARTGAKKRAARDLYRHAGYDPETIGQERWSLIAWNRRNKCAVLAAIRQKRKSLIAADVTRGDPYGDADAVMSADGDSPVTSASLTGTRQKSGGKSSSTRTKRPSSKKHAAQKRRHAA